jgi:hypothetical protein
MASIELLKYNFSPNLFRSRLRRDRAVALGDLVGKVRMLRLECLKCGWGGSYSLALLIQHYGGDHTVLDWKDKVTSSCLRHNKADYHDQCVARCQDLLKIL